MLKYYIIKNTYNISSNLHVKIKLMLFIENLHNTAEKFF